MGFDFNSYKKSIISFNDTIDYLLILENECICVGFINYEIKIYYPEDFFPKITIKYADSNYNPEQAIKDIIFIMERDKNQIYTLYKQNTLYIREIDYISYTYKDIRIINNFNYNYLTKSINTNFFYGIDDKRIAYFGENDKIISTLKLKDNNVEFFYEIPSQQYKEIVIKSQEVPVLYFFDRIKFKQIKKIDYINLYRQSCTPIDHSPFIYYEKDNILGVCLMHDLIYFIDMTSHLVVSKIYNTSTCCPSIIYAHKLNNEKYFVVQNLKACFGFYSHIYIADLRPRNIQFYTFEGKIKKLVTLNQEKIIYARFSKSMKYLILRMMDKSNEFLFYSKKEGNCFEVIA